MGERHPSRALDRALESQRGLHEAFIVAPRQLPHPLPEGMEDAPPPRWHRVLLAFIVLVELLWLGLVVYGLFWLLEL